MHHNFKKFAPFTIEIDIFHNMMNDLQLLGASGLGGKTESVVIITPYLTVFLVSVILTGINRVVVMCGKESVVTLQNIVLVRAV